MRRLVLLAAALCVVAPAAGASGMGEAEVAEAWADELHDALRDAGLPPTTASRRIGGFGVALHESVVGGRRLGRSLEGQLNELDAVPDPEPGAHHWPASANAASRRVLDGLFADASAEIRDRFAAREAAIEARHAGDGIPGDVLARSIAHGRAVADAILGWLATDGIDEQASCDAQPPGGEGSWVPTPPAFLPPLHPCWGKLRPFAMASADGCDPGPPIPFSTEEGSQYRQEAELVRETVEGLTEEQQLVALFWSDDPSVTATPPGHWLSIARQVSEQRRLDLGAAAELLARTGIGVADAFIAAWDAKYRWWRVRPVSYIRDNVDGDWMPFLVTPPFPEYPSGHSVQSATVAALATEMLGPAGFADATHADRGLPVRTFASFEKAAGEAALSRLYGGIHYPHGNEDGLEQGRCVAKAVTQAVDFLECVPGDVHPHPEGNGAVTLGDLVLALRKLRGAVPIVARDLTCGDLHPGAATCVAGACTWCVEGDGEFRLGDALVIRELLLRRLTLSCRDTPPEG